MMSKIGASAVRDHRRILVKLAHVKKGTGIRSYLCGISSQDYSRTYEYVELPSIRGGTGNSCGGLIYLWAEDEDGDGGGVILNPLSPQEFKRKNIPPSTVPRPQSTNYSRCIAAGFGFDSRNGDYKVVRFVDSFYDGSEGDDEVCLDLLGSHMEVYSVQNNHWKKISTPDYINESLSGFYLYPKCVCVNNKCYWLAVEQDASMPSAVVSFDFENEIFSSLISLPMVKDGRAGCYCMELLEYKGYLALIVFEAKGWTKGFEVWVMKNEHETTDAAWEKAFYALVDGACKPLGFGRNWEVMFFEGDAVKKKNGDETCQLLAVDLTKKELKALPNFAYHHQGVMEIFSYSCLETKDWLQDVMKIFSYSCDCDCLPDVVAEKLTRETKKVCLQVYSDFESKV